MEQDRELYGGSQIMAKDLEITARLEWNKPVLRGLELVGDKGMYMIAKYFKFFIF